MTESTCSGAFCYLQFPRPILVIASARSNPVPFSCVACATGIANHALFGPVYQRFSFLLLKRNETRKAIRGSPLIPRATTCFRRFTWYFLAAFAKIRMPTSKKLGAFRADSRATASRATHRCLDKAKTFNTQKAPATSRLQGLFNKTYICFCALILTPGPIVEAVTHERMY